MLDLAEGMVSSLKEQNDLQRAILNGDTWCSYVQLCVAMCSCKAEPLTKSASGSEIVALRSRPAQESKEPKELVDAEARSHLRAHL